MDMLIYGAHINVEFKMSHIDQLTLVPQPQIINRTEESRAGRKKNSKKTL